MKRQRKRVDGKLIYVYKLDRDLLCDRAPLRGSAEADRGIILEAIARRYQMALIENSPNKPSAVPSVSTNIETEAQIEHLELELDGNSAVLPVDHNIDAKGQIEHPDLELDDQSAVLRVPNNIETKALLGHHLLEVELQTSGPSAANYIDDDEQGEPSEIQQDLCSHLAKIYDSRSAIKELALMLVPIDSEDARQDLNQCEFYDRERFNKAAKLLPKSSATRTAHALCCEQGDRMPRN